jgi:hypothetical protein
MTNVRFWHRRLLRDLRLGWRSFGLVPATNMLTAPQRRFCFPNSPQRQKVWVTACKSRMRADGRVVLNNLSEQIRECLQHAEDCAREAAEQPDGSRLKQDYLNLEKRWLGLARNFELGERLTDFTNEANRKASAPITPLLQGQAFDSETVQAVTNALVMTCEALGLSNRDDAMTQLVAEKIIELAKSGLKNPTALHLAAIKEFG